MLNGQIPFVCFFSNSVLVRTIFSEAPLINNGCATHVRAPLIFYSAAALNTLSIPSRVLKAFVRQLQCGPGATLRLPPPPCSSEGPPSTRGPEGGQMATTNPLLSPTAPVTLFTLQRPPNLHSWGRPMPCAEPQAQGSVTVGGADLEPALLLWFMGVSACVGQVLSCGVALATDRLCTGLCCVHTACQSWKMSRGVDWLQLLIPGIGTLSPRFITPTINHWSSRWLNGMRPSVT